MERIRFELMTAAAKPPSRSFQNPSVFEICSSGEYLVRPGFTTRVSTDLIVFVPDDHVGLILSAPSLDARFGCRLVGGTSLLASIYREILVDLETEQPFNVSPGDVVAHLLLLPVPQFSLMQVRNVGLR